MSRVFALDLHRAADEERPAVVDAPSFDAAIARLMPAQRETICRISGVPRARYAAFSSCLGALAASGALANSNIARETLAVLTVGWRMHIPVSWQFAERALGSGAGLVNPLQFPHVLPSASATTIAAVVGSHGPAFGVECAPSAMVSAISHAERLIDAGLCESAIVVTMSDALVFTGWAQAPWSRWPDRFDGAFAVLVTHDHRNGEDPARSPQELDRFLSTMHEETS